MARKPTEKPSFEEALQALEEVVNRLETGELPLEEALSCFERGVQSAQRCQSLLKDVETRVEVLLKDPDGTLRLTPHDSD